MMVLKDMLTAVWMLVGILIGARLVVAMLLAPLMNKGGKKRDAE